MKLPAFMSEKTFTFNAGWVYLAAVVEFIQLSILIYHALS